MTIDCNMGRHESPFGVAQGNMLGDALGYGTCDLNCYGDLELWLKAHCLSLSDGDPVATWSSHSETVTIGVAQSNASFRPTFQTNEINGLPCVEFNGTDQRLTCTGSLVNTEAYTIMIVMKQTASSGNRSIFEMYVDPLGTPSGFNFYSISDVPTQYHSDGTSGQVQVATGGGIGSAWNLFTIQSEDNNTHRIYKNGTLIVNSSTVGTMDANGVNAGVIGAHFNGLTIADFFKGQIAELALYSESLGSTARQNAEACLMNKYALG